MTEKARTTTTRRYREDWRRGGPRFWWGANATGSNSSSARRRVEYAALANSDTLRRYLDSLFAENGGEIPFERFMGEALTHPEFGYYTAHIETVGGSRGDFATSTTLSAILGQAIARWVRDEVAALGGTPGEFLLIEIGAGDGSLMRDVLRSFSWWDRRKLNLSIVEISPVLRRRQRETLGKLGTRIEWHESIVEALGAADGRALVFSNELVDAFPVIRVQGTHEVFVRYDRDQGLRETFLPLSETRPGLDPGNFSALRHDWPHENQRLELHDSYRRWLSQWVLHLKTGSLLTIDYGGAVSEIYHKRPEGSLRAFFRHQRLTGPGIYRMFGKQDLTADVCFDDLQSWGNQLGLETTACRTQAEFLEKMAPPGSEKKTRETAFLLADDGAGGAFKVLSQRMPGA